MPRILTRIMTSFLPRVFVFFNVALVMALVLGSCALKRPLRDGVANTDPVTGGLFTLEEPFLELQGTSCYGTCPVYSLQIQHNGMAYYHGIRHTTRQGHQIASLTSEHLNAIRLSLEEVDFDTLQAEYDDVNATDFPKVIVTYHADEDESYTVSARGDSTPAELTTLVTTILNALDEANWSRVAPLEED